MILTKQVPSYTRAPEFPLLVRQGKRLIVFCDEINLPAPSPYGTQRVITFLRQLTERGGYFRPADLQCPGPSLAAPSTPPPQDKGEAGPLPR